MTKLFPKSQREIYEKNPLVEVVCQLRFPKILKIEGALPVEFQEKIRAEFPLYEKTGQNQLPFPVPEGLLPPSTITYNFASIDKEYSVGLGSEFISLTTARYVEWPIFESRFRTVLAAFESAYAPGVYTRVGLRYINAIQRKNLGLEGCAWSELFNKFVLGELASPELEGSLAGMCQRAIRFDLGTNDSKLLFQHGLAQIGNDTELGYLLDFDYYKESITNVADAIATLQGFNSISGNAFRWCVTPKLKQALAPFQSID